MKNFKIENKGSARLFQNKYLEYLTRTNFIVPVVFYYLLSLAGIIYSAIFSPLSIAGYMLLFPAGILFFTLNEYLIHRFVFHFNTNGVKQEAIQYSIHGVHHEYPRDKDRLVMPPLISILLAFVYFFILTSLFSKYGIVLFSGFVFGYSSYLIIHYAVHALKPPNNFLKYYWKHHSLHHYSSVDTAFSVSFPLWDFIFGTMPNSRNQTDNFQLPKR